jgi:hypothetical protein
MTSFLAERRLPKVSTRTDRLAGAMVKAKANAKKSHARDYRRGIVGRTKSWSNLILVEHRRTEKSVGLLVVAAEFESLRRHHLIGEVGFAA